MPKIDPKDRLIAALDVPDANAAHGAVHGARFF